MKNIVNQTEMQYTATWSGNKHHWDNTVASMSTPCNIIIAF